MTSQVMRSPKVMQPGEGDVFQMLTHTFSIKVNGNESNSAWALFEITDTANNGAPLHTHPWEETFYILDGELDVQVGSRQGVAMAGSVLHVPANMAHRFTINSSTARMLVIVPAEAEGFYRETGVRVSELPADLDVFYGICDKYGVRLIPQ